MEIEIKFAVKKFFPQTAFMQVYFEAVANALDAGADWIEIRIKSDGKVQSPRLTVQISDNGEGFTEKNFNQFKRLQQAKDEQHKGLGRLVYMRYFERVLVQSQHAEGVRRFVFADGFDGKSESMPAVEGDRRRTVLRFEGFRPRRLSSYDDLRPTVIRDRLITQFFPALHDRKRAGKKLQIRIKLDTDESPQQEFVSDETEVTEASVQDLDALEITDADWGVFGKVVLWHRINLDDHPQSLLTAASVDRRTIPMDLVNPKNLPPNVSAVFIVESELFATGGSDSARERLELPDTVPKARFERILRREIGRLLRKACPAIVERNKVTQEELDARCPHLIGLFEDEPVGLIDREQSLDTAQRRFLQKQKDILLASEPMAESDFASVLEVSSRALTEYVLYRQHVVKRLGSTTPNDREKVIHELIAPQRREFSEAHLVRDIYQNNVWMLDDKFMTFRTVLSESEMREVIAAITDGEESDDRGRPDISMIFSADPLAAEKVDVVVVELKKRGVDPKEGTYAAIQLLQRAQKLADHCPNIQRVWYYGIIEIDDAMDRLLQADEWVPLFSKHKVLFRSRNLPRRDGVKVPCPMYLVSFDALVQDASARNHTFLELLRSGFKSVARMNREN